MSAIEVAFPAHDFPRVCGNCGDEIMPCPNPPAGHECWVHDDGIHGCGETYGSDAVAEPAEPDDITCASADEEAGQ